MELTSGSLIALVGLVLSLMGGTITVVVVLLGKRIDDSNKRIDDVIALLREIVPRAARDESSSPALHGRPPVAHQ